MNECKGGCGPNHHDVLGRYCWTCTIAQVLEERAS